MRKKLVKLGKDFGIVIERPILELLDIPPDAELEVRTDGERLIIEPATSPRLFTKSDLERLALEILADHDETFRDLPP